MNVQHAPTAMTASRERHSTARVPGRWIVLALLVWITLVVLTLTIFLASLPMYLAQLQTPCTETACEYQQLTYAQAETLKGMGLSLGDYAALTIAIALASVMVSLVVSTLIIWRRSYDRIALCVALMLVTLGPIIEVVNVPVSSPSPWGVPNECLGELAQALLVLYLIVAWLFPVAILVQVFLAGLSLFTTQSYWSMHIALGHSIVILPLLLVILTYLGHLLPPAKLLTWLLLGISLIQTEVFAMIRTAVPTLAALHPVLALVLFALAMTIALRARTFVRTSVGTPTTSEQHAAV